MRAPILLWASVICSQAAIAPVALADEAPVTLDEIRELRREGNRHVGIVEIIKQRGRGFAWDAGAERLLRRMGFRGTLIEQLKELPSQDATHVKEEREPEFQRFAERVDKILKGSGTGAALSPSDHINLNLQSPLSRPLPA